MIEVSKEPPPDRAYTQKVSSKTTTSERDWAFWLYVLIVVGLWSLAIYLVATRTFSVLKIL